LFDFYRKKVPDNIVNGASFEKWRKQAEKKDPNLLMLSKEVLMQHQAEQVTADQFPDQILINRVPLPLEYHFEPGKAEDGITQTIPLSLLNQTSSERYEWLVPGLLREKVIFLIKALPKSLRRHFIPVPQYADQCIKAMSSTSGALLPTLSEQLRKLTGVEIDMSDWRTEELPLYLQMNFKLVDDQGELLDESRDLDKLKENWAREAAASFRQIPDSDYEKRGLTSWSFDTLPEQITLEQNGLEVTAYPALVDKGDCVDLTLMDTKAQAAELTRYGLRRLFMLNQADAVKYLHKNLPDIKQMCLHYANVPPSPYADNKQTEISPCEQLKSDLIHVAFDRCFILDQPTITDKTAFEKRITERKSDLINLAAKLAQNIAKPLAEYHAIAKRLTGNIPLAAINSVNDIKQQLGFLIYQGFVHDTPDEALKRLPVYCQAAGIRLDRLLTDPNKDKQRMAEVMPHWQKFINKVNKIETADFKEYRWMLEEFRISVFAQELKTAYPISAKRLEKQWQQC